MNFLYVIYSMGMVIGESKKWITLRKLNAEYQRIKDSDFYWTGITWTEKHLQNLEVLDY